MSAAATTSKLPLSNRMFRKRGPPTENERRIKRIGAIRINSALCANCGWTHVYGLANAYSCIEPLGRRNSDYLCSEYVLSMKLLWLNVRNGDTAAPKNRILILYKTLFVIPQFTLSKWINLWEAVSMRRSTHQLLWIRFLLVRGHGSSNWIESVLDWWSARARDWIIIASATSSGDIFSNAAPDGLFLQLGSLTCKILFYNFIHWCAVMNMT